MTKSEVASFEKFNYTLRPSKQLERKLFIEVFHRLAKTGYYLFDYTYLGMGSIYYADFILFHKYLLIDQMICVEGSGQTNRMEFNKPYDFIDLRMMLVSQVVPEIQLDRRYLVWLDYDYALDSAVLADIASFVAVLSPGSIFIVTVESDTRLLLRREDTASSDREREVLTVERLQRELGRYADRKIREKDMTAADLPELFATVIRNRIAEEMKLRDSLGFTQLFNCRYADGAQMLSFGGIVTDEAAVSRLQGAGIFSIPFVNNSATPISISVPPLTVREKLWLDTNIGRGSAADASKTFDLREDYYRTFVAYYRHYPTFVETIT